MDSARTRKNTSFAHTYSRHTIANYIERIADQCFENIKRKLPRQFGLLFDGWSENGFHYVGVFAIFSGTNGERIQVLVAFSTFENEADFSAVAYVRFFEELMTLLDRTDDDMLFWISDNCSTNKLAARLAEIPFIGCASHRLNLTVTHLYKVPANEVIIAKVLALMKRCKTLIGSGKLRARGATVVAKGRDKCTRWGHVHDMLYR